MITNLSVLLCNVEADGAWKKNPLMKRFEMKWLAFVHTLGGFNWIQKEVFIIFNNGACQLPHHPSPNPPILDMSEIQ